MPTPMAAYSEATQRFGDVDPANATAVEAFFVETFPQLDDQRQEEVLAYLLSREDASATTLKRRRLRDALARPPEDRRPAEGERMRDRDMYLRIDLFVEPETPDQWSLRHLEFGVVPAGMSPQHVVEALAEAVGMAVNWERQHHGGSDLDAFAAVRKRATLDDAVDGTRHVVVFAERSFEHVVSKPSMAEAEAFQDGLAYSAELFGGAVSSYMLPDEEGEMRTEQRAAEVEKVLAEIGKITGEEPARSEP